MNTATTITNRPSRPRKAAPLSKRELRKALRWVVARRMVNAYDYEIDVTALRESPSEQQKMVAKAHYYLRRGTYKFAGARRGTTITNTGKVRHHAICPIRDAMVLRAITHALQHVWSRLPVCLMGGRPETSQEAAVARVTEFRRRGRGYIVRWDIKAAFASTAWDRGIEIIERLSGRPDLVGLLEDWRQRQGNRFPGLVEGSPVAMLMLAAVLGEHVVPMIEEFAPDMLIWVDDGVIWTPTEESAREMLGQVAVTLGWQNLDLNRTKTVIDRIDPDDPFPTRWTFLGFQWELDVPIPSEDNRHALFGALAEIAAGRLARDPELVVEGWAEYFRLGFEAIDRFEDMDKDIHQMLGGALGELPSLAKYVRRAAKRGQRAVAVREPWRPVDVSGGIRIDVRRSRFEPAARQLGE